MLQREGGIINFFPQKGGLIRKERAYLRGGGGNLIEDLRYVYRPFPCNGMANFMPVPERLWYTCLCQLLILFAL